MGTQSAERMDARGSSAPARRLLTVLVCALLVAGSTTLPYLSAYLSTPPGSQFQGLLVNPQDGYSYLAKMQQGARGEWAFRLPYTSEDHDGGLIFTFYLALGRLSAALGIPLILTYHLARLLTGVFLLVALFYSALAIFRRTDLAWATFGLGALGSGFGWLTSLFGYLPSDMLIPESTTYYAIFANPHFPLGIGLMLVALLAMLKAVEREKIGYALVAGLLTLVEAFVLPFAVITIYAVTFFWLAWRWFEQRGVERRESIYLALLVGLPLPGVISDFVALYLNPTLAQWSSQNATPSPPPYDYLLGYGLLAILAALGAVYLWRFEKPLFVSEEARKLLLIWPLVTLILLYVPFSLQRRLVSGLHIAVVMLAAIGFFGYLAPRLKGLASRRFVFTVVLVAALPSNLFLLAFTALGAGDHPYPLYLTDDEVAAVRWLGENSQVDDTVLASGKTGNIIPGLAGNRVFYGHPFETIKADEKKALLTEFFGGKMSDAEERSFLSKYGIGLIYYGRSERELGSFDPSSRPYLKPVFNDDDGAIYRVLANPP